MPAGSDHNIKGSIFRLSSNINSGPHTHAACDQVVESHSLGNLLICVVKIIYRIGRPANADKEFGFHDMEHEFLIKK